MQMTTVQPAGARVARAAATPAPATEGTLRIAQMNLWNLFDTVDNPQTGDMVLDPAKYATKLTKIANGIAAIGLPDIISVNEVENRQVLEDLIKQDALKGAGYKVTIQGGNDGRGINVGVLYRADKVEQVGVEEPNPKMSFPDGGRGQVDPSVLYARAPLVVDFRLRGAAQAADGAGLLTIAVNHFKSKLGGQGPEERRQMQGQFLGEWLDTRAAKLPGRATIVLGDLNANYGDGAYEKLANRADGTKRFFDAPMKVAADQRYTYIYRGQKDMLDHMLVSSGREDAIKAVDILHVNSPKDAKKSADDPTVLAGFSDHDPMVADFDVAKLLAAPKA